MKEIGSILNVSTRTVEFHKQRIMELLDLKTNAELVRYPSKRAWFEPMHPYLVMFCRNTRETHSRARSGFSVT